MLLKRYELNHFLDIFLYVRFLRQAQDERKKQIIISVRGEPVEPYEHN